MIVPECKINGTQAKWLVIDTGIVSALAYCIRSRVSHRRVLEVVPCSWKSCLFVYLYKGFAKPLSRKKCVIAVVVLWLRGLVAPNHVNTADDGMLGGSGGVLGLCSTRKSRVFE